MLGCDEKWAAGKAVYAKRPRFADLGTGLPQKIAKVSKGFGQNGAGPSSSVLRVLCATEFQFRAFSRGSSCGNFGKLLGIRTKHALLMRGLSRLDSRKPKKRNLNKRKRFAYTALAPHFDRNAAPTPGGRLVCGTKFRTFEISG